MVVERVEIWRICRESWREQCRRGRPVRCNTAPISCHGGAVDVLLHDKIHANLRCRLRDVVMSQEPVVSRRCHFAAECTKCGSQTPPSNVAPAATMMLFMNLSSSRATMLGFKSRFRETIVCTLQFCALSSLSPNLNIFRADDPCPIAKVVLSAEPSSSQRWRASART